MNSGSAPLFGGPGGHQGHQKDCNDHGGGALRGSGFHIGLKGGRRHGNSRRRRNAVSGCGGQRGTGVAGALEDELIRQDAEQTGPGHADDAQQDSGQAARHQVAKADAGAQAEGKERNHRPPSRR